MNDWVNNREAGDVRPHRAHYDVTVMCVLCTATCLPVHTMPKSYMVVDPQASVEPSKEHCQFMSGDKDPKRISTKETM